MGGLSAAQPANGPEGVGWLAGEYAARSLCSRGAQHREHRAMSEAQRLVRRLNPLCRQPLELCRDLAQDYFFEIDLVTCIVDVNPGEVTLRIIVEDYTF